MSKAVMAINLFKGALKKLDRLLANPYKKIGLNWIEVRRLKNLSDKQMNSANLLGQTVYFWSRDEFLHSLEEIFIEEIYKQKLPAKPYIVDCGANIGLSVMYFLRHFKDAEIVAFEPDELNFSFLKKNTNNSNHHAITIRKEAVWVENTSLSFKSSGSLMSRIEVGNTTDAIQVKAVRLKDLLVRKVDFLKIDIEGAEYEVIKDITEELGQVNNLFIEYHGTFDKNQELNEILEILASSGFKYYIKHAIDKHPTPFLRKPTVDYDVQLNIFGFRN